MTDPVFIPTHKEGHAHPKCYLSHTKGCSTKIEAEHCISQGLLDVIEKQNATIDVTGLSWLPKEELKSVSKAFLVSKILCATHNRALSPLDSEVKRFVEAIGEIDLSFQTAKPVPRMVSIDGGHIERWILKMVLGLVASKQIVQRSGAPFVLKPQCMQLLCDPKARWPLGWGLYMELPEDRIFHSSSFELIPQHDPATGTLLALRLKFNGIAMTFVMGRPDAPASVGEYRPAATHFKKGDVLSTIRFRWSVNIRRYGAIPYSA